jgi:uncharacterized membrane protein YqjE
MLRHRVEGPGLGSLVEDLLGQIAYFIDQKVSLLRLELEQDIVLLVRHLVVLAIGGAIAGLGVVLGAMALAFWVAGAVGSMAVGFGVTGLALLAIGAIIVAIRVGRGVDPSRSRALARTTSELRKDARWLSNGR